MRRSFVPTFLLALALGVATASPVPVRAQETGFVNAGPRFLAMSPSTGRAIDASRAVVLRRRVSLNLANVTRRAALQEIARQSRLDLLFSEDVVPLDRRVTLQATSLTVAAALTEILIGTGVDVMVAASGQLALARRVEAMVAVETGSIAGRITNAKTGERVGGAEVLLEGIRWRTVARDNGAYILAEIPVGNYTLTVRRVGYSKQSQPVTVAADRELAMDVALQPAPTQLNEIVTTAAGEQRLLELGHVVGRVNVDSLVKEAPVTNLSELLTARVAGVQVFQDQGTVGGNVRIQIRGRNSFYLGNQPIFVVDGVRYVSQDVTPYTGTGASNVERTSPFNDINPNDIQSIEVVKGPSAATLYGTDAANGVVVITTKRGLAGRTRWNLHTRAITTGVPKYNYADPYWGWQMEDGAPSTNSNCALFFVARGDCVADSVRALPSALNDPQLSVLQRGRNVSVGTDVSGGKDDLLYYFSTDLQDAGGTIRMPPFYADSLATARGLTQLPIEQREPNALSKLALRAALNAKLAGRGHLRVSSDYVQSSTRALRNHYNPYADAVLKNEPGRPYGRYYTPEQIFGTTSEEALRRFVGNAQTDWRPTSWLELQATVGLDLGERQQNSLAPAGVDPNDASGFVVDNRLRQTATTAEFRASVSARKGRLSFRTTLGTQYVRSLLDGVTLVGQGLPPGGSSINDAASKQSRRLYDETVTLGSYVQEVVGLNERLYLTGALRIDGASSFGQNYDAVPYPKVSASWLVSDEPFFPRVSALDEVRLRYAFGASGRQPSSAWKRPGYGVTQSVRNGAVVSVVGAGSIGNADIRPERVTEHEWGFDAAGLSHRIELGVTWYNRSITDQILSVPLAPGYGSIFTNIGLTKQHGFEVTLLAHLLDTKAFTWDVSVLHGLQRNKLISLGRANPYLTNIGGFAEGYPLGARFSPRLLGYADANGDGIIVPSEVSLSADLEYAGESDPPVSQSLSPMFGLFDRRLRVSALLERRTGFTQVNETGSLLCFYFRCRAAVDPTTPLADQAAAAAIRYGYHPFEDGTFTRLREVSVAFDLPSPIVRALRVNSASAALSVRNLALWTGFSGPDPETLALSNAETFSGVPQGRSWNIRIDLGF